MLDLPCQYVDFKCFHFFSSPPEALGQANNAGLVAILQESQLEHDDHRADSQPSLDIENVHVHDAKEGIAITTKSAVD